MQKYCKTCGFVTSEMDLEKCPICQRSDWEDADLIILKDISDNPEFLEAMLSLKKKDPIEYQLKLSQFKTQLQQQTQPKESAPAPQNVPKCPTCGSTDVEKISLGKKVVGGALFGLFSSNVRKTMHCRSCGYKW